MRKDADLAGLKLLRVDGGVTRNDMLMQMQVRIVDMAYPWGGGWQGYTYASSFSTSFINNHTSRSWQRRSAGG